MSSSPTSAAGSSDSCDPWRRSAERRVSSGPSCPAPARRGPSSCRPFRSARPLASRRKRQPQASRLRPPPLELPVPALAHRPSPLLPLAPVPSTLRAAQEPPRPAPTPARRSSPPGSAFPPRHEARDRGPRARDQPRRRPMRQRSPRRQRSSAGGRRSRRARPQPHPRQASTPAGGAPRRPRASRQSWRGASGRRPAIEGARRSTASAPADQRERGRGFNHRRSGKRASTSIQAAGAPSTGL